MLLPPQHCSGKAQLFHFLDNSLTFDLADLTCKLMKPVFYFAFFLILLLFFQSTLLISPDVKNLPLELLKFSAEAVGFQLLNGSMDEAPELRHQHFTVRRPRRVRHMMKSRRLHSVQRLGSSASINRNVRRHREGVFKKQTRCPTLTSIHQTQREARNISSNGSSLKSLKKSMRQETTLTAT
ncbi:uncharacterized protein V6R79_021638 [Siganus canaliculatus]